ncbi:hypothetical protein IFM89_035472 [Coptis chinensis]|uniref:Uncharacterized protein n=1 Tax=Coptis chinensis TaxID=261450 RepID=A0A835LGP8_9MAGN|nr:hypothetical protein IFM89_035472 [Coptis chinensis]
MLPTKGKNLLNKQLFDRCLRLSAIKGQRILEDSRVMRGFLNKVSLILFEGLTKERCIAVYLFSKQAWLLGKKSGLLFLAMYLKQCSACLQRAYAGDKAAPSLLPVPVSLTRSGFPSYHPCVSSTDDSRKDDKAGALVQIYLSFFTLSKVIELAKPVSGLHSNQSAIPSMIWIVLLSSCTAYTCLLEMIHSEGSQDSSGILWPSYTRFALDPDNKIFSGHGLDYFEPSIGPDLMTDAKLVRFGLLWKCYDMVVSLGLHPRVPILGPDSTSDCGWLFCGLDGTRFLVRSEGLIQPRGGGRGVVAYAPALDHRTIKYQTIRPI